MIAVAVSGRLELVDLASCQVRVLAHTNALEVRFSPNGRWVAYSPVVNSRVSGPVVVSVHGGRSRWPLGNGILAWQWAPKRELVYGITGGGALVAASPTGGRRVVAAHLGDLGLGAGLGVSPNGQVAVVSRPVCGASTAGELEVIDLRTGARKVVVIQNGGSVEFAGFSPGGRWLLFWPDYACSASLAADGSALDAVPAAGGKPVQAVSHVLHFADFLSWCGRALVAAAGPDRETQTGSALIETVPPAWRQDTIQPARKLSWVSPSCAPSGLLAAAAGPNNAPVTFGLEHRSIWLLRPDGAIVRRLTSPPERTLSDEAQRFSRDGRWVLFVRSRVVPVGQAAISHNTLELEPAAGGNAVAIIAFTSDDFSYYDHFGWPEEIDWHQPR